MDLIWVKPQQREVRWPALGELNTLVATALSLQRGKEQKPPTLAPRPCEGRTGRAHPCPGTTSREAVVPRKWFCAFLLSPRRL